MEPMYEVRGVHGLLPPRNSLQGPRFPVGQCSISLYPRQCDNSANTLFMPSTHASAQPVMNHSVSVTRSRSLLSRGEITCLGNGLSGFVQDLSENEQKSPVRFVPANPSENESLGNSQPPPVVLMS